MCRTTDFHAFSRHDNNKLKIKAFLVQLWSSNLKGTESLPESLTLLYLPRINGHALEIEGTKVRPECPAFVTLHRVVGTKMKKGHHGEALYASRERVKASEGACFEIYVWEEKVVKGVLRKDEYDQWRIECRCVMEDQQVGKDVKMAEVCVGVEGRVDVMREKVEMVVKKKRREILVCELEDIPEEISEMHEDDEDSYCSYSSSSRDCEDDCCCSCGDDEDVEESERMRLEKEMDGVGWAVDVGIWVMCLGVGYLVSKASAKKLLKRRIL